MEFSRPFRTGGCAEISPDGRYVASSVGLQVVVRHTHSAKVLVIYTCNGNPSIIRWSADSYFLLCVIPKYGLVNVFDVQDHSWDCVIDGGDAGAFDAQWAPDSKFLLLWAEHGLKVTVWSVTEESLTCEIWGVKSGDRMISWRKGGGFAAFVVEDENGEAVCVYETKQWKRAVRFQVDGINDIAGIQWGPNGRALAVWDGILSCRVALISPDGYELGFWEDDHADLGIKKIEFSPDGTLLAVGGHDQVLRILDVRSFNLLSELDHERPEIHDQAPPLVYRERIHVTNAVSDGSYDDENIDPNIIHDSRRRETINRFRKKQCDAKNSPRSSYFDIEEGTDFIDIQRKNFRPECSKTLSKVGIGTLTWAPGNYRIASRNDNTNNVIFVWDIQAMRLVSLIILEQETRAVAWENSALSLKSQELLSEDESTESDDQSKSPAHLFSHFPKSNKTSRVAIATANRYVYLWSEDGAAAVSVPESKSFGARRLQWSRDNSALLVIDHVQSKSFALMYP